MRFLDNFFSDLGVLIGAIVAGFLVALVFSWFTSGASVGIAGVVVFVLALVSGHKEESDRPIQRRLSSSLQTLKATNSGKNI